MTSVVVASQAASDVPGLEAEGDAGAGTVLAIDDDPNARDLLKRMMTREGFRVITAPGGEEGLRLAKMLRPDAITLDVMMPGMDGWTVLARLKADAELANIPVIIVTIVDRHEMGFALGASDYVTKPIDSDRLTQLLRKYRCKRPPCPILVVEDDVATRDMLKPKHAIPIHYGTFPVLRGTPEEYVKALGQTPTKVHSISPGDKLSF